MTACFLLGCLLGRKSPTCAPRRLCHPITECQPVRFTLHPPIIARLPQKNTVSPPRKPIGLPGVKLTSSIPSPPPAAGQRGSTPTSRRTHELVSNCASRQSVLVRFNTCRFASRFRQRYLRIRSSRT